MGSVKLLKKERQSVIFFANACRAAEKMKKILSIFLCIAVLFGLVSCGKNKTENATDSNINTAENSTAFQNNSENNTSSVTDTQNQVEKVKITIPEGYTLLRISWLLEEKGLCSSDDFVNAAQSAKDWIDLSEYPFLKDAFNAKNVCFYLEGYIFPLTYEIPKGTDVKSIIKMFLNGAKARFDSDFMAKVQNSGYNVHEILTIASIVEKEACTDEQRPMVASVLYNRLKEKMPFQCDVCINYCEGVIKLEYPDKFPTVKEYYNSKNAGLIAGPICNPGMKAINAALSPASTDYLYFIIGTVPPYEAHYSKTYEEHDAFWQANKDRLTGK